MQATRFAVLASALLLLLPGGALAQSAALTCYSPSFYGVCIIGEQARLPDAGVGGWHTHVITTEFTDVPYGAALPSSLAKGRMIDVRGPNGYVARVQVTDVGPFCGITRAGNDDAYVFGSSRPFAEKNIGVVLSSIKPGCNGKYASTGAALDLTPAIARELGISGKGYADWRFAT